jgi:hypothetical protein
VRVSIESFELFEGCDDERETLRQLQEAADLSAMMRTRKADISRAAGILERESPLFYGKGDNTCLF